MFPPATTAIPAWSRDFRGTRALSPRAVDGRASRALRPRGAYRDRDRTSGRAGLPRDGGWTSLADATPGRGPVRRACRGLRCGTERHASSRGRVPTLAGQGRDEGPGHLRGPAAPPPAPGAPVPGTAARPNARVGVARRPRSWPEGLAFQGDHPGVLAHRSEVDAGRLHGPQPRGRPTGPARRPVPHGEREGFGGEGPAGRLALPPGRDPHDHGRGRGGALRPVRFRVATEGDLFPIVIASLLALPCGFGVWQMFRHIPEGGSTPGSRWD